MDGIISRAFFLIEEKRGLARLPCCRHRSEHIAGTVPSFPRHTAIPTLHLGKDVKNTAKLAVPAFTGTPVFGHQAIAYFIVRHQVLLLSHSSVNFHSQLKVGSSISLTSKWVVIASHTNTYSAFSLFPVLFESCTPKSYQKLDYVRSLFKTFKDVQLTIK